MGSITPGTGMDVKFGARPPPVPVRVTKNGRFPENLEQQPRLAALEAAVARKDAVVAELLQQLARLLVGQQLHDRIS